MSICSIQPWQGCCLGFGALVSRLPWGILTLCLSLALGYGCLSLSLASYLLAVASVLWVSSSASALVSACKTSCPSLLGGKLAGLSELLILRHCLALYKHEHYLTLLLFNVFWLSFCFWYCDVHEYNDSDCFRGFIIACEWVMQWWLGKSAFAGYMQWKYIL